jgi:murein L,D-transpeptidase YcbB/YkuD
MEAPPDDHDFPVLLYDALKADQVAELVTSLRPPVGPYGLLRAMLPRYRALAADPTLTSVVLPAGVLHPGDQFDGLPALRRRLIAFGDLAAGAPPPVDPAEYDAATVEGVKRFQARHGLADDGVVGKGTTAALAVPLAWRVRQIELGLERLRWLPHLDDERLVAVNIPMFRLWAWNAVPPTGVPDLTMGVIVGRALDTETPVFVEEMAHVIFRPYWNIPRSIVRSETLPAIERDPYYLSRQDMEMVRGDADASPVVPMSEEAVELLRQGVLRVRQRPGPRNALGLVKFMFPNDENVYMHSTPAQELFSRTRRDFSHGCVRVEDPVALAEWVLRGESGWARDRIVAAMAGGDNQRVNLAAPVRVVLFYITAVVMPDDGVLHFAEDMYGHDAKLDRALVGLRVGG